MPYGSIIDKMFGIRAKIDCAMGCICNKNNKILYCQKFVIHFCVCFVHKVVLICINHTYAYLVSWDGIERNGVVIQI